jgi:hypothetical protein
MQEILQIMDVYVNGGALPDGSLPEYSDDIQGSPESGLARRVATPSGNLGFGRDLVCWDDLTPEFMLEDPHSTLAVVRANYRRINTPLGFLALIGEPADYGHDVKSMLQKGTTPQILRYHEQMIEQQILDDDRNGTCRCVISELSGGGIDVKIDGSTIYGNYSLTVALVDGDLLIRSMTADGTNHA